MDLDAIFDRLDASLRRYAPPLVVREGGTPGKRNVHLWTGKEVEIAGRRRRDVYFGGAVVQKGYVGLYFMPTYTDVEQESLCAPDLLALRRGKSCFHVKRLDDGLAAHVDDALARGFELYRERGWVE